MKNRLNIFTYGYYKGVRFILRNVRQFFRNFRYAWQRCTRGYADPDVWELFDFYTAMIHDTLYHLSDTTHGFPGSWSLAGKTHEDWQIFLKETADILDRSRDKSFEELQFYKNQYEDEYVNQLDHIIEINKSGSWTVKSSAHKELADKYFTEEEVIFNKRTQDMKCALDRLKEHWWELWD